MKKSFYSIPVLLEMAVIIEESSESFYKTLEKKFPKYEETFKYLATDEKYHAKIFTSLLGKRRIDELHVTEEEKQLADHNIKILEDTRVVGNLRRGAIRASEVQDLKTAIDIAIQMEKDTSLFYYNLSMGLVKEERQEVYKIIKIEHSHLAKVKKIEV
jgi:rubrerythrin